MKKKYSLKKIFIGRSKLFYRYLKKIIKTNYLYLILNYFNFLKNRIIRYRHQNLILIDGGANLLQGFENLLTKKIINKKFKGFLFEPNPNCIPFINSRIKEKGFSNMDLIIEQKALSDENKIVNLRIEHVPGEHRLQYTDEFIGFGTYMGGATSILENEWVKPGWIEKDNFINEEVEAISMSEYLLSNFDKSNYIVCKLDVEGAEFKIIQDLIKQNCLKYLNEAYVEWHPQYNSNYSSKDVSNLKKIMIRNGMYVGFWL